MNDQDFKKIFEAHKVDIPDNGFSKRVINQLPERKNILPQIVMVTFIMVGLVLVFVLQGFTPMLEQLYNLAISISRMQMPSPVSITVYLGVLALLGIIGYSIMQADAE
ncbi:MAG: DUF5056 domain-containing protein [Dysgonamonadaceae bacterium]|jgi:uncharacterized membrane protein|nr:DUF5056 domain-containing protein [Dysgonamonadaceae bacterium]